MTESTNPQRIYDGEGDRLMEEMKQEAIDRIILLPDKPPSRTPDDTPKLRIMWGQHLLEDLLVGRYRSLVCAVNPDDNTRGIIAQLADLLPTSQWNERSITARAKQFSEGSQTVKVLKYDMDSMEVLALLRPPGHPCLTLDDLARGFKIVTEMIRTRSQRHPSASVSFLGARSNALVNSDGQEPSFETVLRIMYESGYTSGDVYPAPGMWTLAPTAVYARYPFPPSIETMRHGGVLTPDPSTTPQSLAQKKRTWRTHSARPPTTTAPSLNPIQIRFIVLVHRGIRRIALGLVPGDPPGFGHALRLIELNRDMLDAP